ncbi:MAG: hypothetical protein K5880_22085 [Hydrogenophaga sp.]|jgi:hypothetical protein|uniref:hypothetical protein n=1 Tax=Hydrogenophaga sp. TaxID=1904254 RepID=UPI00261EB7B3|nr:hypothetical protein [Hydrogenophaga sp.]MCV0441293.1 hypothetical protein [Hydrogenophaga sp.]
MPNQKLVPSSQQRGALSQLLDHVGNMRFRRSDLSERLLALTSPRSRARADALATVLIKEAAAQGRIRRDGHQHWVASARGRTLRDGSLVPELNELQQLSLHTRCPQKWLAIDMESGEVWQPTAQGWRRATPAQMKIAARIACD